MLTIAAPWTLTDRAAVVLSTVALLMGATGCQSVHDTATADCESCPDVDVCSDCDEPHRYCYLPTPHYVRCLDEKLVKHDARYRANVAMRSDYNAPPSTDVRAGYRDAFVDIALGGSGEIPPVPPEWYWGTCYRTAEGHAKAQDWFAGYAVGASRALATCQQSFNKVPSSGQTAFVTESASTTSQSQFPSGSIPPNTSW